MISRILIALELDEHPDIFCRATRLQVEVHERGLCVEVFQNSGGSIGRFWLPSEDCVKIDRQIRQLAGEMFS
jgi:hypothetical protein